MGSVLKIKYFLLLNILFLFLCFLGIYQIKEKAGLPFKIESKNNTLNVSAISNETSLIGNGDEVLSINGYTFSASEEIEVFIDGKKIGDYLTIKYKSSGTEKITKVQLLNYYNSLDLVTYTLSGILFLVIGLFTIVKASNKKSTKLFYWGCSGAALLITMTPGSYAVLPEYVGFFSRFIFHFAYCFTPVVFVHFILNFPAETNKKTPLLLIIAYVAAAILALVLTITFILSVNINSTWQIQRYLWIYNNVLRTFVIICFLSAVFYFIYSYKNISSVPDKKKLKWILFGFVVGPLGYAIFWVFPYIFFNRGLLPEFLVIGLLSTVPITFAIAIVKYHFFDIDFIINRSLVYLIVLGSLFALYMFLFAALSFSIQGIDETIPALLSVSVVAFALQPAKNRIQVFVDKKFFHVQYNYRAALKKFLEEIDSCVDLNSLAEKIVNRTNEFIPVEKIGFFELQMPDNKIKLISHRKFEFLLNRVITFRRWELKTALLKPVALIGEVEEGVDVEISDSKIFNRWGMSLVFPFKSENNEISGFLVLGKKKSGFRFTVEDIDLLNAVRSKVATTMERNKYQRELVIEHLEKEKLAELNEMKSFFVSSVSHDLKTPITSIKIFTDMLKNLNQSSEKSLNYLNIIDGESTRLTRLIDNVLDYTRIEKGVKEYNFENVQLNEIVKETVAIMEYQLRMNRFECQVNYSEEDHFICADKDSVKEAVINLISNAIKYSREKKEIFVRTFSLNGFNGIEVKDSGIGIASEELKNIFEPFFRSKYLKGKKVGGTGIGLSIVKHIVDAHKGNIEVKSEPGKGTCFTMLFPMNEKL
jgi:signal transduction histidine kinase